MTAATDQQAPPVKPTTTADDITPEMIASYRERGFIRIPGIISKEEAAWYRAAAETVRERMNRDELDRRQEVFSQHVNVWLHDAPMRQLTLHPNVAAIARKLAGVASRLWHDHILTKAPHNKTATEFHQDQAYWPHENSPNSLSAWIALQDVPVERGCMTFLPGSHRYTDLPTQNLRDAESLFTICPELRWSERVTVPLQAGDCTFHHGRCAHMATPNNTDEARVAHVVIFMDATTTLGERNHVCTSPLNLKPGQVLDHEHFPRIEDFEKLRK